MANNRSISRSLLSLFASLVLFLVALGLWFNRQALFDKYRLHNYQPSSQIVSLANDDTMNAKARHIFYVQHPELNGKSTFNGHCSSDELTIVLGCYISGQQRIYLLDVNDPRLAGVEQVTAAHEMLHAVYDRLSKKDKTNVDKLIIQAYAKVTDKRIRATVDSYKTAGADTSNELHSILGTEVANLPPALEAYYKQYFTDRSKIVSFSEHYEGAFSSRQQNANTILKQIKNLEGRLETMQIQIDSLSIKLNGEKQTLERQRQTTDDPKSFNKQVDSYNTEVHDYKNLVSDYNNLVGQHNDLVKQYQSIALEENQLIKAIDSRSSSL